MIHRKVAFLLFSALLFGCASTPRASSEPADLARLQAAMTGTFDSSAQAETDGSFYNIRLVMVPLWTDRTDGPWLYVEQAVAEAADRPYRQRVYHLIDDGNGAFRSEVYTLPGDPQDFTSAWTTGALDPIVPAMLDWREGCAIYLNAHPDGTFTGSTRESDCTSTLRGASYATSEVTITPTQLISWDRGWDANNEQVWGAVTAGYVFVKKSDGPPTD